jgi:hypothetical protein
LFWTFTIRWNCKNFFSRSRISKFLNFIFYFSFFGSKLCVNWGFSIKTKFNWSFSFVQNSFQTIRIGTSLSSFICIRQLFPNFWETTPSTSLSSATFSIDTTNFALFCFWIITCGIFLSSFATKS